MVQEVPGTLLVKSQLTGQLSIQYTIERRAANPFSEFL